MFKFTRVKKLVLNSGLLIFIIFHRIFQLANPGKVDSCDAIIKKEANSVPLLLIIFLPQD